MRCAEMAFLGCFVTSNCKGCVVILNSTESQQSIVKSENGDRNIATDSIFLDGLALRFNLLGWFSFDT